MIKQTPIREKQTVEESPLITWGKVEDVNVIRNNTNKYKIPDTPLREDIGIKMANKTSAKKREEKLL